jgi:hypothetical protein
MKLLIYDDLDRMELTRKRLITRGIFWKQAFHLKLKISKIKSASRYANFILRLTVLGHKIPTSYLLRLLLIWSAPDFRSISSSTNLKVEGEKFFVPLGFSMVCEGVYRSAYPRTQTWAFIKTLELKSIACLTPADLRDDFIHFCERENILLRSFDTGHNQEPYLVMASNTVAECLAFVTGELSSRPFPTHSFV